MIYFFTCNSYIISCSTHGCVLEANSVCISYYKLLTEVVGKMRLWLGKMQLRSVCGMLVNTERGLYVYPAVCQ